MELRQVSKQGTKQDIPCHASNKKNQKNARISQNRQTRSTKPIILLDGSSSSPAECFEAIKHSRSHRNVAQEQQLMIMSSTGGSIENSHKNFETALLLHFMCTCITYTLAMDLLWRAPTLHICISDFFGFFPKHFLPAFYSKK